MAGLRCEVFSTDLDATASFYVGVLGFEVVRDERFAASPYLGLVRGGVRVGVGPGHARAAASHRRPPAGVELVLEVDDLDRERARVRAAGWPVVEDVQLRPWGLRDFRLEDPDGSYWRVTTVVPVDGVRAPLRIAAAQPPCVAHDVAANVLSHAAAVRAARARVVVFPELSLTGYELDASPVVPDDPALAPLVQACAAVGALALVGAPVLDADGRHRIGVLAVDRDGCRVVYRKTWLGGDEPRRFAPGDGPTVLAVDGWRLGLGVCKDTGSAQHTVGTAALGVDVYVAGLVHRPEELAEQEARAVVIARTCRAPVVFASFAGPTGDVFDRTAGCSAVWAADGTSVARTGPDAGGVVVAELTEDGPRPVT